MCSKVSIETDDDEEIDEISLKQNTLQCRFQWFSCGC